MYRILGKNTLSSPAIRPTRRFLLRQKHVTRSAPNFFDPGSYAGTMTIEELKKYHQEEHFGPEVLVALKGNLRLK